MAIDLKPGDLFWQRDGGQVAIEEVSVEFKTETIYNFEVATHHNYAIGQRGFLVHNTNGRWERMKKAVTGWGRQPKNADLPIHSKKQEGHIPGTPSYRNRIKQGKTTSGFFGQRSGDAWTQKAWREGTPTGDPKIKIFDAGVSVGTGPNGGMQRQIRVVIDSKGRIHGTPWGPEF